MQTKIIFFYFVFGLFSLSTFAQEEDTCVKINNFSVEQRNQNYPFNKAKRIVFTSFKENSKKLLRNKNETYEKNEIIRYIEGEVMKEYFDSLKVDFSRYNPDDFEEKIDLSEKQKDELTNLIFNFGTENKDIDVGAAKCYVPRNAILYFDENNQLFAYMEVCFECNQYRVSDDKIDFHNDCGEKLYLLKDLFAKVGIKYGVVDR